MGLLTRVLSSPRTAPRSQMALHCAVWLFGASVVVVGLQSSSASAGWQVAASGSGRALAQTIPTTATPTASAVGRDVAVSWAATALSGGTPASGYVVRRFDAALVQQTTLASCTSVTTNSCVESNVPSGTWTYSVQATRGNWLGSQSARSASVTVSAGMFTITAGQKVKASATITGGAITGFVANEAVAFRVDSPTGVVLTASITNVSPAGSASGITLTLPGSGITDGTHTIVATGANGSTATSGAFVHDSVAPVHSLSFTNVVASFWNGTTMYFNPSAAGSFRIVDAFVDGGSGPASVTFPSFSSDDWSALVGSTVSMPAGGPYTSNTYSWSAGAGVPSTQIVSGLDGAGNASSVSISFTSDAVDPALAGGDLRIAPVGNTTTPGFVAAGGQYYVYANASDGGSGLASVTADVSSITSGQTAVPLGTGTYTVGGITYGYRSAALTATVGISGSRSYTGTATDRVGRSRTSTASVSVDSTAPSGAITVPANGASVPASTTVTSSSTDTGGSGVHSATFEYKLSTSSTFLLIATDTTAPSYSVSWDTTLLTQAGSYHLRVVTTDNAGNTFTSPTVTVTVDRVAPTAPSTPALAPLDDSGTVGDDVTNATTPTFTGTAEAGTTVRLFDGATQVGSATASLGIWSVTTSALTSGTHSITARATDGAGNVSVASAARTLTIDGTAPAIAATDLRIAPIANTTTAGYIRQGGQYYVYANVAPDVGTAISVRANVNAVTTGSIAVTLTPGTYVTSFGTFGYRSAALTAMIVLFGSANYTATATDAAGNSTTTGAATVNVENTAPSGTITAPAAGAVVPGPVAVSSNSSDTGGSLVAHAAFEYSHNGTGPWTLIASDPTSPYSVTWDNTSIPQGSHAVRVTTTDNAGNAFTSPAITVAVDTIAPAAPSAPLLAPASDTGVTGDNRTNLTTPTVAGTAEAGTTVKLFDGATQIGTAVATGGNWAITTSALTSGAHTLTATATDSATNLSVSSASVVVTVDNVAPATASVTMANGPAAVAASMTATDTVIVTFSEQINATTFCSAWTNSGTQTLTDATINISNRADGGNDGLGLTSPSCVFNLGAVYLGNYSSNNPTFTSSTVSWDPATFRLTVTFGALANGSIRTGVQQIRARYLSTATIRDVAGNAMPTTIFTDPAFSGL